MGVALRTNAKNDAPISTHRLKRTMRKEREADYQRNQGECATMMDKCRKKWGGEDFILREPLSFELTNKKQDALNR
jgi:hypothetical protein